MEILSKLMPGIPLTYGEYLTKASLINVYFSVVMNARENVEGKQLIIYFDPRFESSRKHSYPIIRFFYIFTNIRGIWFWSWRDNCDRKVNRRVMTAIHENIFLTWMTVKITKYLGRKFLHLLHWFDVFAKNFQKLYTRTTLNQCGWVCY